LPNPVRGTIVRGVTLAGRGQFLEETMPIFLLWAIPAVIVVGGGGYFLIQHLH
jgi:hypothetical protein